jgi:hypothetical protein
MGVYDDVKTAVERLLTPDIGEIKARLGAVELKIDEVDGRAEGRDRELTRLMERGFDRIEERLDGLSRQLRTEEELRGIAQRLAAVESRLKIRDTEEATH